MAKKGWWQKKIVRVAATSLIFLVGIYFLPGNFFHPFRQILVTITYPVQNMLGWSAFELRSFGQFIGSLRSLKQENEALHAQVLKLQGEGAALPILEEENRALRQELSLDAPSARTLVRSEVIAHEQDSRTMGMRINRGERSGIRPGMAVVAGDGILIGRVDAVAPFTAEVRLLTHAESLVGARVDQVPGEVLVRGDHGVGLVLDLARLDAALSPGQRVVTSGKNDGLPSGLLIGTIGSTHLSDDQLFRQATLIPPVRTDELRFVSVVTHF